MTNKNLYDLIPAGLEESEYAELAMLLLDQAGMSLLRQKALRMELGLPLDPPARPAEPEPEKQWYLSWVPGFNAMTPRGPMYEDEIETIVARASGLSSGLRIQPDDGVSPNRLITRISDGEPVGFLTLETVG